MLRGGLPWACHLQRPCSNGPCQGPRSDGLATANEGKGCPILHRVCELLLKIHLQLLRDCLPPVLTHKLKDWSWGAAEQQAFDVLKGAVTTLMLTFPSKSSPFCLECDASNFATGAILSQQQEDGLFHLIGFMSKSFSNTEWNYQIHNKEMLVIMCALEEWR